MAQFRLLGHNCVMSGNVATGNVRKILESRFRSRNNKMWLFVAITLSSQGDQPMLPFLSDVGRSLWHLCRPASHIRIVDDLASNYGRIWIG